MCIRDSLEPALLSDGSNLSLLRASDKRTGNEGDRIGVRAFREGDSLRLVHWAQTAKCGRLIVSERQGPAQSSVVIAIDTDPEIVSGSGPNSSFESSIRIAASLCEQFARQNVNVLIVANRESWDVQPTDLSRRSSFDRLAGLRNDRPLELSNFGKHDERFVVTTSTQKIDWGPAWKAIALPSQSNVDKVASNEWITIDTPHEPVGQFAHHWNRKVRQAWRGTERRGVAS